MTPRLTRRAFLLASAGAGLTLLAPSFLRRRPAPDGCAGTPPPKVPPALPGSLALRAGWLLTPEDAALVRAAGL